ncbi:SDR family oxidoreductase [Angustibacter peucedani]
MTRIALVTGGSRGLGRATALALADGGTDVVLTYRGNADLAADVVAEVEQRGRRAAALQLDTAETTDFAPFVAELREVLRATWQRETVDVVVNNAGVGADTPLGEITAEALDAMHAVHVRGPVLLTQALAPMIEDGGRVLNFSTGLARFVGGPYLAYAAAKGGIEVATRYLAVALAPRGIAVNVLAPGATATDFAGGRIRDDEGYRGMVASVTAMGRVGEAEDVGRAAAALLAEGAGWITGQRVEASGGMRM